MASVSHRACVRCSLPPCLKCCVCMHFSFPVLSSFEHAVCVSLVGYLSTFSVSSPCIPRSVCLSVSAFDFAPISELRLLLCFLVLHSVGLSRTHSCSIVPLCCNPPSTVARPDTRCCLVCAVHTHSQWPVSIRLLLCFFCCNPPQLA